MESMLINIFYINYKNLQNAKSKVKIKLKQIKTKLN